MGHQPILDPGVLKSFTLQAMQTRARESFADKHRAPSWGSGSIGDGSECNRDVLLCWVSAMSSV